MLELLDDLRDRIWSHYQPHLLELLRQNIQTKSDSTVVHDVNNPPFWTPANPAKKQGPLPAPLIRCSARKATQNPRFSTAIWVRHIYAVLRNRQHISIEGCPRQKIHYLGEKCLSSVHDGLWEKSQNSARIGVFHSNRHHPLSLGIPRQSWVTAFRIVN